MSHFVGRSELLAELHGRLQAGDSQPAALLPNALHGMGGVGKTQLAVEYAWRHATDYDLVWWLRAETLTTVRQGLSDLADQLGLPGIDTTKRILNVLDFLQQGEVYPRWLLVFDNADDPALIRDYLPSFGHVLVTSRNPLWADVADQIEVNVFSRPESVTLLQRRGAGISAADADALADFLGDLPLALDQAAAWQAASGAPVADLIRLLRQRMSALADDFESANYPISFVATWDLAFQALRETSPSAAALLQLLAFFGPDAVAVPMLRGGSSAGLPAPIGPLLADEVELRKAIRQLGRYALARPNAGRDEVEIHRLIQNVLRDQLPEAEQRRTRDLVHRIIGASNHQRPEDPDTWRRHAELLPHITPTEVARGSSAEGHRAVLDQITFRRAVGDYESSIRLARTAVETWTQLLDPDHEFTLRAMAELAKALWALGSYPEAKDLDDHVLARFRTLRGEDDDRTLDAMRQQGADLRAEGRFRESLVADQDAYDRHVRNLGAEDLSTDRQRNNLALSHRLLGEVDRALALDEACLDFRREVLAPGNPRALLVVAAVARDYADAGRYTDALTLLRAEEPSLRTLGNTLIGFAAGHTEVIVRRRAGAAAEALSLSNDLTSRAEQVLPTGHPYHLAVILAHANVLHAVGESRPARHAAQRALDAAKQTFDGDHPFVHAIALDLAVILRALGEREQARDLDRAALHSLTASLGDDHPYTLVARANLATDEALAGNHLAARDLSAAAYEQSVRVRGPERPETLVCALNHAYDLEATGDGQGSRALFDATLVSLHERFGTDHPAARAAAMGRRAEADLELWVI